jgi:error-prone DNA polymerase
MVTAAALEQMRDGQWADIAGLVLVRQRPGSAKGVLFITIEDETGVANLIVWAKVFEENRRTVLTSHLLHVGGRVQREGEVIHIVARHLSDMTEALRQVSAREAPLSLQHGGDQVTHGSADPRDGPILRPPRDIFIPDLRLGHGIEPQTEIRAKTRDFR